MAEKEICISSASVCRFLYPLCTAAHLRTPHCTHFLMFAAYEYLKWKSHNQLECGKPILTLANSDMHVFIKVQILLQKCTLYQRISNHARTHVAVCCVWATELHPHAHLYAMHASSPSHSTMLGPGGTTLWLDRTRRVRLNARPPSVPHWKKRDRCTN